MFGWFNTNKLIGTDLKLKSDVNDEKIIKKNTSISFMRDGVILAGLNSHYNTGIDLRTEIKTQATLINEYRSMAMQDDVDDAVDDIVNAAITCNTDEPPIKIDLSKLEIDESKKNQIQEVYDKIEKLTGFRANAYQIFRDWYVDGKIYAYILPETVESKGIGKIEFPDPRYMKHIVEIDKNAVDSVYVKEDYFVYDRGSAIAENYVANMRSTITSQNDYYKIEKDSIVETLSGVVDCDHVTPVGYLHKARKPLNNLRSMEDSIVIYRVSRAAERRIFYVDVGNLPTKSAEAYVKSVMNNYKNKMVYDPATGKVTNDPHISMNEDYWMPRREGGRGTEIDTLPAGQNLGDIDDIHYFRKKLYRSLNVPVSRLESESIIQIGANNLAESNREEWKFSKFVERLRRTFSQFLLDLIEIEIILTGVMSEEDWNEIKGEIIFTYTSDSMVKAQQEMQSLREKTEVANEMMPFVGKYVSHKTIMNKVFDMTDEEIKMERKQIDEELKDELFKPVEEEPSF